MGEKVLITPRSFVQLNANLVDKLKQAGLEVILNHSGKIMNKAQMIQAIAPCSGVILGVDPMDEEVIAAAPKLKAIAKYGVGIDNIDMLACQRRSISVSRTIGANSEAVADYTMALLLTVVRRVLEIDRQCRNGDWTKPTTLDVNHGTLGLIGLGTIGRLVAERAAGFSIKVLAFDPVWDTAYAREHGILPASVERIFQEADFISLHVPLTEETRGFVTAEYIGMMKRNAVLINTARGGLIDEDALLAALRDRRIAGAGLDAFCQEPPTNPVWFTLDNVVLGSHCAAATIGACKNMGRMAIENLLADLGN